MKLEKKPNRWDSVGAQVEECTYTLTLDEEEMESLRLAIKIAKRFENYGNDTEPLVHLKIGELCREVRRKGFDHTTLHSGEKLEKLWTELEASNGTK